MNKLLSYYQKELGFLKQHSKIFASRFPKIARRLGIVEGESEDPHVSRLIESFALLTSRIHQRIDNDIPDMVDALISVLAPQFLRPLPSACIVMLKPDPLKSGLTGKNFLAKGSSLFTRQNTAHPCQFRTVYPVTLLPLSIQSAALHFNNVELNWQLKLCFQVWPGARLAGDCIRLYLHGPDNVVHTLHTLLCSEVNSLFLRHDDEGVLLPGQAISEVGFSSEEAMLALDSRISPVHTLLLDYFWFPKKFSFIDVQLPADYQVAGGECFSLTAVFERKPLTEKLGNIAKLIGADFFQLHCTPVVNLFSQRSEPIILNEGVAEYPIISDNRFQDSIDVWSVDKVNVQCKSNHGIAHYTARPLLEKGYTVGKNDDSGLSWQLYRREFSDAQSVVSTPFIAFSEQQNRLSPDSTEIITIEMTCTNHELPHEMQYGLAEGDFDHDFALAGLKIVALTHPTRQISPFEKSARHLKFLSQLTLNYQLLDSENGVQQLKDILELYRVNLHEESSRLPSLIKHLTCDPVTIRLISNDPFSLARGIEIELVFATEAQQEPGYFLFCTLLDRLLGLFAPVNSFSRLTTRIENDVKTRRIWPVRSGKLSWL